MCDNGPVNKEYEQVHRLSWDELEDTVISNLLRLLHLVSYLRAANICCKVWELKRKRARYTESKGYPRDGSFLFGAFHQCLLEWKHKDREIQINKKIAQVVLPFQAT